MRTVGELTAALDTAAERSRAALDSRTGFETIARLVEAAALAQTAAEDLSDMAERLYQADTGLGEPMALGGPETAGSFDRAILSHCARLTASGEPCQTRTRDGQACWRHR